MEITANNAPHAFEEAVQRIRTSSIQEDTRNGPVFSIPDPVTLTIKNPTERFLYDPHRRANPVFHTMETVWMLAGMNTVDELLPYNKRYSDYAEQDGIVHGAYGHRWIKAFGFDQIGTAIQALRNEPTTRRVVLQMWDAAADLNKQYNDLPCNTQIYFRNVNGKLRMTVCNRSNDLVWGMLGANIVHMSYLHELIALEAGIPIGEYVAFTNNMHFYQDLYPNGQAILDNSRGGYDYYYRKGMTADRCEPFPLLDTEHETWANLATDCHLLMTTDTEDLYTTWANNVALPLKKFWQEYKKEGVHIRLGFVTDIEATDIREAVYQWVVSSKK